MNEDGCPCGHDCCDDPLLETPDHDCPVDEMCEICYVTECLNCGASCACDL